MRMLVETPAGRAAGEVESSSDKPKRAPGSPEVSANGSAPRPNDCALRLMPLGVLACDQEQQNDQGHAVLAAADSVLADKPPCPRVDQNNTADRDRQQRNDSDPHLPPRNDHQPGDQFHNRDRPHDCKRRRKSKPVKELCKPRYRAQHDPSDRVRHEESRRSDTRYPECLAQRQPWECGGESGHLGTVVGALTKMMIDGRLVRRVAEYATEPVIRTRRALNGDAIEDRRARYPRADDFARRDLWTTA